MRPITVSVGPLAAASASAIASTQQPTTAGQLTVGLGNPAGSASTYVGNCTAAAGVLTVTSTVSGQFGPGPLSGPGLAPNTVVIGPAPGGAPNWIISPTQTFTSRQCRQNTTVTLDAPRQVLITNTEASPTTFTVYGKDAAGTPIQETLLATGANLTTQQSFKVVTQVTVSAVPVASISVGTTGTATSQWVNFDPWAAGNVSYQADLAGAANYTVQISNDDPNSPTNPVPPGQMTWLPDPNAGMVGASTPQFAVWQFVPLWARVLLNSGAGAVTATFVQTQNVNR
jgi:hypothetical protein